MKNSLLIVACFGLGILCGAASFLPRILLDHDFTLYALYLLVFVVGVSVGIDREAFTVVRQARLKILLVPGAVIAGSLGGGALASLILPGAGIQDSMAVAAGFGYYSLSSVFIAELRGEALGTIALLSNLCREIITLLMTPLFARAFGPLAPVASGGATAMDTTLPVISQYSGTRYAMIAVFSGTVLTLLVPFLVPFILSF